MTIPRRCIRSSGGNLRNTTVSNRRVTTVSYLTMPSHTSRSCTSSPTLTRSASRRPHHPTHRCLFPEVPHHQAPQYPVPGRPFHDAMLHPAVPPTRQKKVKNNHICIRCDASVLVKPCLASNLSIHHMSCPVGKSQEQRCSGSQIRKIKAIRRPIRTLCRPI